MIRSPLLLTAVLLAAGPPLLAQSRPTYIQFTPNSVKGALYVPDSGPAPHIAVLIIHRTANVLATAATRELSSRGFMVLAVNPRSDNNEAAVNFEANALDIKSGIEFLRKQPGISKILLWGHSGGGPATSFYQAVAENGVRIVRAERLTNAIGVSRGSTISSNPALRIFVLRRWYTRRGSRRCSARMREAMARDAGWRRSCAHRPLPAVLSGRQMAMAMGLSAVRFQARFRSAPSVVNRRHTSGSRRQQSIRSSAELGFWMSFPAEVSRAWVVIWTAFT